MQTIKWIIFGLLCFTFNSGAFASSKTIPITVIPPTGIVIDSPGTYVFGNDITWTPTGDGQAILIESDNVVLDLHGHTLESIYTTYSTVGILATASSNLTIKNGTIANMGLGGISCALCENILVKDITIDGLNKQNVAVFTVPVGILFTGSSKAIVKKCTVKNIDVRTASTAAIQMTATLSSQILDCHVVNLLNRDGACTGIGHLLSDDALVKSCTLTNIQTQFINNLNTEGHTAIGIIPFISANLVIENCKVSNIKGCCDDAHGISIFECVGAIVKKCKVENVLDGAGPAQTGAKSTGIEVYATGVKVIKCKVKNIIAINPQDKQSTGFSVAQSTGVEFIKCIAEDVYVVDENGNQNPSLGYGTGFGWAPDPRIVQPAIDTLYQECTAKRCQVGFDSWFHINALWTDIKSICNGIPILDGDQPPRTLSCDPCSECGCTFLGCYPAPFTITIDDIAANNVFVDVKVKSCK